MRCARSLKLLNSFFVRVSEKGFTLLEIAVVMIMLGLVIAPAASMYHQHRIDKDIEKVEDDIAQITNALGSYRATYGRYPCPAATNIGPGNAVYGFEFANNCTASAPAAGSCSNGVCTRHNSVSTRDVIIGSIPYKALNLQESNSFDSGINRYVYAVTLDLTSNVSFNMSGGGISVLDTNDMSKSLITPKGEAHFVVLSHGKNGFGGISRSGASGSACASGSAVEQENCDSDAAFAAGGYDIDDFDDRVAYFTPVEPSEWQYSASGGFDDAIHLKNTDSFAIGADATDDLGPEAQITVKETTVGSGSILATGDFRSEELCKPGSTGAADCFEPELIGGALVPNGGYFEVGATGGMSCYDGPGTPKYMVGISNSNILCTDEIYMACPSGKIVISIDADGNVKCDDPPGSACLDKNVPTTCGNNADIQGTWSGNYDVTYSGECRKFAANYDWGYFDSKITAMADFNEVQPLIDTINAEARVVGDCGTDYEDPDTQVRDVWQCNNGNWNKVKKHERKGLSTNFPVDVSLTAGGTWPAENDHIAWPDVANNDHYHDCWCREDYQRELYDCGDGYSGSGVRILKHPCPQTIHEWIEIYDTDLLCQCTPGTIPDDMPCADYYDIVAGTTGTSTSDLVGTVTFDYEVTCDADGNAVISGTRSNVDTSACGCPPKAPTFNRSSCPPGLSNTWSWTWGAFSDNEIGKNGLTMEEWICPPGGETDGDGNFIPHPGDRAASVAYGGAIPACLCDSSLTKEVDRNCPAGLQGTGRKYLVEWDCTLNGNLGGWEVDEDDWDLIEDNCHKCKWQSPTGAPDDLSEYAYGEKVDSICTCGSAPSQFCHITIGPEENEYWSNCPCVVQTD